MKLSNYLKITLSFCLFVCLGATLSAQGTVKGFIKDASNGEPILFISVYLEGTNYAATTDLNGYYSITKIPEGTYTVIAGNIEFERQEQEVTITGKKVYTRNFKLSPATVQLGGAEISADGQEQETQIHIGVETIRPQDIRRVPSFGGQPDIVQVLQTLPGFISTGDQGGQLYIRGGSPVQNKVLLDGMIVYNAFHSIGLFSVFDSDIISNADVYTGGFNAEFGGRISSVMNIKTKDGNKSKMQGKLGASPFGAKLTLEGPLKKLREDGSGISYVLSAKTSYLEESSKLLYSYIDEGGHHLTTPTSMVKFPLVVVMVLNSMYMDSASMMM